MKTLGIPLLRTLIAFEATGSCIGAAHIVHRTQAAVSVHLKKIEEITGKALFVKHGRRIKLNSEGYNLVVYARRIVQLHNEALKIFETTAYNGTLRIGLPDDYVGVLLTPLLIAFETALPNAQLDLHCAPSAVLRPMLNDGSLDFAIVSSETNTLDGLVLRQETAHWISAPGYIEASGKRMKLILFPEGCILRKWALNSLRVRNLEYDIVCVSQNMQALKVAMAHGLGVMIATRSNIPPGSIILDEKMGFPSLPDVTIMMASSLGVEPHVGDLLTKSLQENVAWNGYPQAR